VDTDSVNRKTPARNGGSNETSLAQNQVHMIDDPMERGMASFYPPWRRSSSIRLCISHKRLCLPQRFSSPMYDYEV